MPELRQLRYFVAVAEELNFTRAAQRLHMTQPPLSAAIRRLERQIGAELFSRTSRQVRLTAAGRQFLEGARRTLAEADRAVATAQRAGAGELGRLRVGFSWSARFETLPAIGQAYRARHPEVELVAQEMWNVSMVEALQSRTIDVAVALCPEVAPDLADEVIRTEQLVALVPAVHPLAGAESLPLNALADEVFVLFPRDIAPRLHDALIDVCRRAGFEPRRSPEALHTVWTLGMLADAPLVTLVCTSAASAVPPGVVAVPLSEPESLETRLVWRQDDSSPTLDEFRTIARVV